MSRFLTLFLLCISAHAATTVETVTVSVTNAPSAGDTLTINAAVATWTNVAKVGFVTINANCGYSGTNLFNYLSDNPITGIALSHFGTNGITLKGSANQAITVTASGNWGSVAYSTQTLSSAVSLRLPITVETSANQTNISGMLADAVARGTNSWAVIALLPRLFAWTQGEQYQMTNTYVTAQAGIPLNAYVLWPDGTPGAFAATNINGTFNAIDGYYVTYPAGGVTIYQATVTRDNNGVVISAPPLAFVNMP